MTKFLLALAVVLVSPFTFANEEFACELTESQNECLVRTVESIRSCETAMNPLGYLKPCVDIASRMAADIAENFRQDGTVIASTLRRIPSCSTEFSRIHSAIFYDYSCVKSLVETAVDLLKVNR